MKEILNSNVFLYECTSKTMHVCTHTTHTIHRQTHTTTKVTVTKYILYVYENHQLCINVICIEPQDSWLVPHSNWLYVQHHCPQYVHYAVGTSDVITHHTVESVCHHVVLQ